MPDKVDSVAGKRRGQSCHYPISRLTHHARSDQQTGRIRWIRQIGPIVVAAVAIAQPAKAADVDAVAVQRAIDRGVTYLRRTQTERGGWDEFPGYSCGKSALCTLALLNAGVERDDPDIVRAMKYLRGYAPNETYSVALQTLVYCQLGAAGDLPKIHQNVRWLSTLR